MIKNLLTVAFAVCCITACGQTTAEYHEASPGFTCSTKVIYVYVPIEGDAGVIECPPQTVCETPDAGSERPDCDHGKKTGNPHCH